jgi:hypothetical protein
MLSMGESTMSTAIFQFANCERLPGGIGTSWIDGTDGTTSMGVRVQRIRVQRISQAVGRLIRT